jgi:peptidyl-prolyl cis-trans isomerase A (cyclophilin A)
MRLLAATISICTVAVLGTAALAAAQTSPKSTTSSTTSTTKPRTSHMTESGLLHPATLTEKAPESFQAKFTTTKGDFVVEVTRAWAPVGADRFYNLVKHGYFTNAAFFRVVPGFMVQFGLNADPAVNKAWQNANLKDDKVTQSNAPGMITFATAGPNTRTTQLFINYGNNTFLDSQGFAPFGKVVSGMDVVQKINSEYRERPDQGAITSQGKAYLDKNFPNIDSIQSATIVPAAAK